MLRLSTLCAAILLFVALLDTTLCQTVFERNGNVFYKKVDGGELQITKSGRDFDPSCSADGRRVVFVRSLRQHKTPAGDGVVVDESEIITQDLTTPAVPRVVLRSPIKDASATFGWFSSPHFSADNEAIYFLVSDYSIVSRGLFRLDTRTDKISFVASALKYWVVRSGGYRDNIIIHQYPMLLGGGRYDVFNMIKPSGEFVGVVGFSEEKVEEFLTTLQ